MPVPQRAERCRPGTRPTVAFLLTTAVWLLVVPAHATPAPSQAAIERLGTQVSQLDERINEVTIQLVPLNQQVTATQAIADRQLKILDSLRRTISERAAAQYTGSTLGTIDALLSEGNSTTVVQKAEILDLLAQHDGDVLASADVQTRLVASAMAQATQARDALARKLRELQQTKGQLERKLAQLQALQVASKDRNAMPLPANLPVPSGKAGIAVRTAKAQIGKPYHWGAAGPMAFDCSGLTMFAWAAASVYLPHSALGQYESLPHVPLNALAAGDLVFFGNPIHHVGIYIGDGLMIAAPATGRNVQVQPIKRPDYAGAARPS